ncbi:MAG: hypothetical protein H0V27_06735 [Pyrinomonadaceae bacterium]|nr:hypothetical protein [Pyrinomonadaceae bacterium]
MRFFGSPPDWDAMSGGKWMGVLCDAFGIRQQATPAAFRLTTHTRAAV